MKRAPLSMDEKFIVQYILLRRLGIFPIYGNPMRDEFHYRSRRMPTEAYNRATRYVGILLEMAPETV